MDGGGSDRRMRSQVSRLACVYSSAGCSAADVINNVLPAAFGVNVAVGLKVRHLVRTLAPLANTPPPSLTENDPFISDCSQLGVARLTC